MKDLYNAASDAGQKVFIGIDAGAGALALMALTEEAEQAQAFLNIKGATLPAVFKKRYPTLIGKATKAKADA